MQSITAIGCGAATISFLRKYRESGFKGEITVIDRNPVWYDRARFYDKFNFKDRVDCAQFCKEVRAKFIKDEVDRVNPKRKKIYFKNRESISFDCLVAAPGLQSKKMAIKGEHREGFMYLSRIDILALRDRIKFADDICIQASTLLGIKWALHLRSLDKDVSLTVQDLDFLGEEKERFVKWCEERKVGLYTGSRVSEAIGEATVKAVKFEPLKVVSAQILLIDSGFISGADFFEEPLEDVKTMADIFIIGDAAVDTAQERFFSGYAVNAAAQGEALAQSLIAGQPFSFSSAMSTSEGSVKDLLDKYEIRPSDAPAGESAA